MVSEFRASGQNCYEKAAASLTEECWVAVADVQEGKGDAVPTSVEQRPPFAGAAGEKARLRDEKEIERGQENSPQENWPVQEDRP